MCFGSKKNNIYDEEPPRPAPGHAPQQPVYAPEPKQSTPAQYHQQRHQQPQEQQQAMYPQHPQPTELPSASNDYAPPPGPPPSHPQPMPPSGDDGFAPPPGPPPSYGRPGDDFAPPRGPPPSHSSAVHRQNDNSLSYIAPPPGPPPPHAAQAETKKPSPQHDWATAVPDTALLPPPPSFFSGWDRSPATNASEDQAEAGERWCAANPLQPNVPLGEPVEGALHMLQTHNLNLIQPTWFRGSLVRTAPGVWEGHTEPQAGDMSIIAYPPLYKVSLQSPLLSTSPSNPPPSSHPQFVPSNPFSSPPPYPYSSQSQAKPSPKTIYYEVEVIQPSPRRGEVCLALGYAALPYPQFRMPGWHRGSLAVHGDDGHRFINDRWGGKTFTEPFAPGERYGIGMTFTAVAGNQRIAVDVFFTRQGRESGRWNLHEETDAQQDLPVVGLEGYHDLACAIGTFGQVGFRVFFRPEDWLFKPAGC